MSKVIKPVIIVSKCKIDKTRLSIDKTCTQKEWKDIGIALGTMEGYVQWWIGDWIRFGEKKWGEMYKEAEELTGLDYITLRHIKATTDRIELGRRRPNLSYSHHIEVAKYEPKEQEKLLNWAEENQVSVQEFRKEIKVLEKEVRKTRKVGLPRGIYNVVYADPPWEYRNTGFDMSSNQKYETMNIEEIKDLRDIKGKSVQEVITENAVLFLWVTNPMLKEGLEVLEAWGFEYKTNFVWIKERHTAGFYVYGKHELLLIGVKGSFLPIGELLKSVIIEGKNIKHSEKPKIAYKIIETMYPNQKYLELFARNKKSGWKSWGNEI